jgi:methionyl-tRNA formyltransferase
MYRIVFMGTPDFAVSSLRALIESGNYDVWGVISQPDRPHGRGRKVVPTPVKEYASSVGIPTTQFAKIKSLEGVHFVRALRPDFLVVAAYGQILSQEILDIPKYACVNVHASLLPKYRGAAPLNYAIMNGEKESGVTIMHMEAGMDTGGIYAQVKVPITPEMTAGELTDLCKEAGAKLLVECLPKIAEGTLKFVPQDDSKATKATLLTREMEKIDWHKSAQQVHDHIRGFNPEPGAYTMLPNGKSMKIWSSRVVEANTDVQTEGTAKIIPGQVLTVSKKSFIVACGQGALEILEVQPESKKKMLSQVFLNGHGIAVGDVLDSK